ncbi:MAG: DNA adenine methylase [Chloroflexi bacterium]|nr:DNA adenine methylase [Chloroflexota bacterium]
MKDYPGSTSAYSARLLSPFRYPGGKTWLVPRICHWLDSMEVEPAEFIEPFAGGGIVGLNVAFRQLADRVTLVELDDEVSAVWQTVIHGDARDFAKRIATFDLTLESVNEWLAKAPCSVEDRAFRTILRNRVNRGGILASGAGMLRNGEDGRGIKSRWYPVTLSKRILEIAKMRDRITFVKGDGLEVLRQNANRADVAFFIDPPYTAGGKRAGRRLYTHHQLDHEELFRITSICDGDFLMTYSNDERVRKLAQQHGFDVQEIAMKSSHHEKMTELLIGRDLDWAR